MPATFGTFATSTTYTTTTTTYHAPYFPGSYQTSSTVGYYIEGTDQGDRLYGSALDDTMHGLGGNDVLFGQDGNDFIFGEAGNDQLYGGIGADTLDGGNDNDTLIGGAGADVLIGGQGIDTASYVTSDAVTVELGYRGFGGEAEGDTYSGVENVIGSNFDDTIIGDAGNNTLNGGAGNDQIKGGAGRDILIGGAGQDQLWGDTTGVRDSDVFVIQKFSDFENPQHLPWFDKIMDFQVGLDKIQMDAFHSSADFGDDGQLARGILNDDGTISQPENLDPNDKLFYDVFGGLYECTVGTQGSDPHLLAWTKIAEIHVDGGSTNQISTSDFLFV